MAEAWGGGEIGGVDGGWSAGLGAPSLGGMSRGVDLCFVMAVGVAGARVPYVVHCCLNVSAKAALVPQCATWSFRARHSAYHGHGCLCR